MNRCAHFSFRMWSWMRRFSLGRRFGLGETRTRTYDKTIVTEGIIISGLHLLFKKNNHVYLHGHDILRPRQLHVRCRSLVTSSKSAVHLFSTKGGASNPKHEFPGILLFCFVFQPFSIQGSDLIDFGLDFLLLSLFLWSR